MLDRSFCSFPANCPPLLLHDKYDISDLKTSKALPYALFIAELLAVVIPLRYYGFAVA